MARRKPASIYVNSPLVETVFEIRFPGEPTVECHRDRFFDEVRKDLPNVLVPNAQPGQPVALQPYHFRSNDGQESVLVALNRFAYTTRKYESFTRFAPRALALATRFCELYGIKRLNRTGLRYVNVIPFLREDGVIPWKRFFTVNLTLPATSADNFVNASLAFESRCDAGVITTRIGCAKAEEGNQEVFVLDFDFAKTEALVPAKIKTYLAESHEHTKRIFEGIVTDSYKSVMRGEVIQ
jgi:uncharacterized protein (TIGR04255 family)